MKPSTAKYWLPTISKVFTGINSPKLQMRDQQTTAWDDKLRPGLAAYFCKVVLAQNHAHLFTAAFTLQKQS